MALGACTGGWSVTELWLSVLEKRYKCWGLNSEYVTLDNGTRMHCWTPTPPMAENGVWSVPNPKPPLVLLQGFAPNAMLFWKNQVPALVRHFNVYVPDLVFLGKSVTAHKGRLTESFQAECVVKMLQFLGVQDEVDVVGTGYGGLVAFRMAQLYPKFVNKVVFSSTGICGSTPDALLQRHGCQHLSQLLVPESVAEFKVAFASAPYWRPWLPSSFYRDMVEVLYRDFREERRQLVDELVLGTAEGAAPALPKLMQEKFLILWGEHDELFKPELAYELQKHLGKRRATVVLMKECSHAPQLERPKEYNRIVKEFLLDQHIPQPRKGQVKPTS